VRTLAAGKKPASELERHALALLEELRARHASSSAQRHIVLALERLFAHLRKQRIREPRSVQERHLVSFARALQTAKTPRNTPLSLATQAIYLQRIRQFFDFLVEHGVLLRSPAAELRSPVSSTLPRRILSEREASRLMTAPSSSSWRGKRDRALLELLYGTGIRRGECVRLDVTDVDLQQGRLLIRNTKGKRDRVVPLAGRAAATLDLYLREPGSGAVAAAVARALLVLADDDLLSEHVLDHPGRDLPALQLVLTEKRLAIPADEHEVGMESGSLLVGEPVDEQPLALANAVLLAADGDDRVAHEEALA